MLIFQYLLILFIILDIHYLYIIMDIYSINMYHFCIFIRILDKLTQFLSVFAEFGGYFIFSLSLHRQFK